MFGTLETDIVAMQETKIQRKNLRDDMVFVSGWDVYLSLLKHKKGATQASPCTRARPSAAPSAPKRASQVFCVRLTRPLSFYDLALH
ncbi:hypothetical protein B0T25DRAFT_209223 [Lasiosphaeria hispida]|uniref:Endonuclease/exonuclease/phosphatase domain-containing protein n=1 Tax=Lasiosphaeria hispida TaxID=260671 RepID=A0AAJ0HJ65_9PEZI|nr:hypothetical protein B0T25DRAFT_209223 [Lasiosphaeria hispida]